jgi:hypothetical protein
MSLVTIAKHLESQGRGKDSHLVHMTTDELKSLQHLAMSHGGSLTINPHTGLPEAGFLSAILPMAIGAGLALATGGTSLALSPAMAGLVVGGGYTLATGSLSRGLMAGLGAWGGAGMTESLAAAGTQGTVQAGGDVAAKQFAESQSNALKALGPNEIPVESGVFNTSTGQLTTAADTTSNVAGQQIAQMGTQYGGNLTPEQVQGFQQQLSVPVAGANPANLVNPETANIVKSAGAANAAVGAQATPLATVGQGLSNQAGTGVFNSGANAFEFAKNNPAGVLGTTMAVAEGLQPKPPSAVTPDKNPFGLKMLSSDFQGTFPPSPSPGYQATYRDYTKNPYTGMAGGGVTHLYGGGEAAQEVQRGIEMATKRPVERLTHADPGIYTDTDPETKNLDAYHAALYNIKKLGKTSNLPKGLNQIRPQGSLGALSPTSVPEQMAAAIAQQSIEKDNSKPVAAKHGGLQHEKRKGLPMSDLGSYSDGGHLLKGPGDGVSDSIPATISGKKPARLADGEFVIPARIVSELGNGSTDAGAKRLYAMMDRIKAKRAKAKDIAADTKVYKYLPA